MAEATKTRPGAESRARLRLPRPDPRPLAEFANSSYSAFVGAMKVVLPAIAVGLIILVVAWPKLRSHEKAFRLGIADIINKDDVESLRMINPRFQGINKGGEPFTVTAKTAIKTKPTSDVYQLVMPQGDITTARGNWVTLKSDWGAYREQDQQLDLIGSVDLYHDSGYEFRTLTARINIATNYAEGDDPVEGEGPMGEIHAQGFRIYDKGERILFTGKVHLLLRSRTAPKATGPG